MHVVFAGCITDCGVAKIKNAMRSFQGITQFQAPMKYGHKAILSGYIIFILGSLATFSFQD